VEIVMSHAEVEMTAQVIALGRVLDEGRGSLPFALVHGEALVTCATWALSEARVLPVDARTTAEGLAEAARGDDRSDGLPLVLHDSLCPMTPPAFIAACVRRAVTADVVVAGVRPVTDTVKTQADGILGATVDREALARVVAPVVVPGDRVAASADLLADPAVDLARLVETLRATGPVELLAAPPEAMRVGGPDDVRVLEALTHRA
jgi:2-C-methyl-D-erythritol 4-phosphate cytidylyltransferase